MPEWIHNRAEHLLARNPDMKKSTAFAVATQQSHALGKSPKGYGTSQGRHEAKQKYDTPKDDTKAANPGHLESPKMAMPVKLLEQAAAARGVKVPALNQIKNMVMDPARRREIAKNVVSTLRGIPKQAEENNPFPYTVIVETTGQGGSDLPKLLKAMQALGGAGHSFGVQSDDSPPKHLGGWDGDGSMRIGKILVRDAEGVTKQAGIAVQYDEHGRPKHAETSDEWLAAHFKDTGTFLVPDALRSASVHFGQSKYASAEVMMSDAKLAAFRDEFIKIAMAIPGAAVQTEKGLATLFGRLGRGGSAVVEGPREAAAKLLGRKVSPTALAPKPPPAALRAAAQGAAPVAKLPPPRPTRDLFAVPPGPSPYAF